MNRMFRPFFSLVLLAMTPFANASSVWPIEEAVSQSQCAWPSRDATARLFENEAQWQILFPTGQPQIFAHAPDWRRQVVVALTLGARPTPGFTIELSAKQFEVQQDVLRIGFREHRPAAGEITQQMLTQPCIFVLTPRGTWRHAVLRNADSGAELGTNAVTPP